MGRAAAQAASDSRASSAMGAGRRTADISLERLGLQLAEFRREHRPSTRIPDSFRDTAVALIQQGITRAELRRICGFTSNQLDQWHKGHGETAAVATNRGRAGARIFSVEDDIPVPCSKPATLKAEHLELRLGGWSVSICWSDRQGAGSEECCR